MGKWRGSVTVRAADLTPPHLGNAHIDSGGGRAGQERLQHHPVPLTQPDQIDVAGVGNVGEFLFSRSAIGSAGTAEITGNDTGLGNKLGGGCIIIGDSRTHAAVVRSIGVNSTPALNGDHATEIIAIGGT